MDDAKMPPADAPTIGRLQGLSIARSAKAVAGHRYFRAGIGLVVTIVFCWLIARKVLWGDLVRSVRATDLNYLPWMVLVLSVGLGVRITRWWIMLRNYSPSVRLGHVARVFLSAMAINNLVPLRAGDVMRMFAFRADPHLGWSRVAGTLIAERLLDLTSLLAIFFIALRAAPSTQSFQNLASLASWILLFLVVALVGLVVFARLESRLLSQVVGHPLFVRLPLLGKILRHLIVAINSSVALGSYRRVGMILCLSFFGWLIEGGVFVLGIAATGAAGGVAAGLFALTGATFGTVLPSSPGYVGTFHFFAAEAVSAFGNTPAAAMAFAVAVHGILWLTTTSAGLVAILISMRKGAIPVLVHPTSGAEVSREAIGDNAANVKSSD